MDKIGISVRKGQEIMLKGVSRRVVVVKPEGNRLFEQAIFIMRDDVKGCDEESLMREACMTAEEYVRKRSRGKHPVRIPAPAFAAAGAAITGVAWLVSLIK